MSDPFGRTAHLAYDSAGHLEKITDVIGLESQFEYSETVPDFMEALTTPYGRTSFATGESGIDRWIEITDPLGGKERIAYANTTSGFPSEPVPQGGFSGDYLQHRNTFYWDKRANASGVSQDFTKAQILHWLHTPDGTLTSGVLESQKKPLENRVWYLYPGQGIPWMQGSDAYPIAVARVLDDGTTQRWQYQHNARGKKVKEIDPLGRETVYVHGTDNAPDADPVTGSGLDLLQVKRKNGASYDAVWSATYDAQHQPLTVTDALGKTTTYTYNAAGQVLTVTPPPAQGHTQGAATTFTYDANGYLTQVSGPVPGATTTFTYDYGRRRTVTDAAGLTLTYDYDALDRVTRVTYPDGTYEETVYNRLDAEKRRDRLGRWTQTFHDALRRPVATRDAAGGTTQYQYGTGGCYSCAGGGDRLTKLVDAKENTTAWDYDLQGRLTTEMREDGRTETYAYETTTSRLKTKTDRKGVTTTFAYGSDDKLTGKTYSDTTPAVSYTYDPVDGLMLTAANGTDTLTWTYDNLDRVATEASAKNASTVGYTYDDAGNRATLSLDGSTYLTYGYDPYSRLASITRGSYVFGFGYDTASRRTSMTYPNGVVTTYGYDGESRLVSLAANKGSTPITSFSYVLDAAGNRTRKTTLDWSEDYSYDSVYRLISADRSSGSPSRWRFAYDAVGNRTADQTDDASNGAAFNSLNQLLSRAPGGALAFRGTTNEPAAVTVAGQPAQTTPDNAFSAQAPVLAGTTDVAVTATDPSGNARTNTYRVSTSGAGATYSYDPNGNLTSKTEGTDTWGYEWNAENQLTKVEKNGSEVARFAYDPMGRRVEKLAGGVTTTYTHDGEDVAREMRAGASVRYVHGPAIDEPLASDDGMTVSYYHVDALGSIVASTNAAGGTEYVRQYDAWGRPTSGASTSGYAFTGREWDAETGLHFYRARYYDPSMGRFISEDPIGLAGGLDLYAYVLNQPTNYLDPFGLQWWNPKKWWDNWNQAKKQKKCAEAAIECDKRVQCKCDSETFANSADKLNKCQAPGANCCLMVVLKCEAGMSFDPNDCAPPVPTPPAPSPTPTPNPCDVYGQTSKECQAWWSDWKKKHGGEW